MVQAKLLTEQQVFDATSGAFSALAGYTPADGVAVVKKAVALMHAMKSVGGCGPSCTRLQNEMFEVSLWVSKSV